MLFNLLLSEKVFCDALHQFSKASKSDFFKYLCQPSSDILKNEIFVTYDWTPQQINFQDGFLYYQRSYDLISCILGYSHYASRSYVNVKVPCPDRPNGMFDIVNLFYNPLVVKMDEIVPSLNEALKNSQYDKGISLNNYLFMLYQKIALDKECVQLTKKFYSQLNHRNESIKKLFASASSSQFFSRIIQCDFNIPYKPEDLDSNYQKLVSSRQQLISTMRNIFAGLDALHPIKYVWTVTQPFPVFNAHEEDKAKVRFKILLFTQNVTDKGKKLFFDTCDELIDKYKGLSEKSDVDFVVEPSSILDDENNIYSPCKQNDKKSLLELTLLSDIGFFVDRAGFPKSTFGLGGIGGRKYK